jgi:hypothetical protein
MRAALCLLLLGSVAAQNHLRVPQHYPEIRDAVAAAQPGDVIWVTHQSTPYQPIAVDKPLTILGLGGVNQTPIVYADTGTAVDVQLEGDELVTIGRLDAGCIARGSPSVRVQGDRAPG